MDKKRKEQMLKIKHGGVLEQQILRFQNLEEFKLNGEQKKKGQICIIFFFKLGCTNT